MVPLANANAPGKLDNGVTALTNTFPKWSPFNFQRTGELGSAAVADLHLHPGLRPAQAGGAALALDGGD